MGLITNLHEILNEDQIVTGPALKERYNHIWKMQDGLNAKAAVLPETTEDVSNIMKICDKLNQPVVVHGGLTNLVGSTETNSEEVVVSMERMNNIESVDVENRTMTVQAGVILQNVQDRALEYKLIFPMNFGAKGSAQIGGIVSTNAGGLKVLKYGMTRSLILGLETVLSDGTIISSLKRIIKDNSGYDVKQFFIGSEGTLGIVTKAVLKLMELPTSRVSAFLGTNSYSNVIQLLKFMDKNLAGQLSSFELIWSESYNVMTGDTAKNKPPLPQDYKYNILLEGLGAHQQRDQARFEEILEEGMTLELFEDAVIATTESDFNWFWNIREDVHVLATNCSFDQHFDVSLPTPLIGAYADKVINQLNALDEVEKVFTFGHVADGNIHFIVGKKNESDVLRKAINEIIYNPLKEIGGSVSAEHGIGLHKKEYLSFCRSQNEIQLMKRIKEALDPKALLNPGKVI